jgi:hypothetical protein
MGVVPSSPGYFAAGNQAAKFQYISPHHCDVCCNLHSPANEHCGITLPNAMGWHRRVHVPLADFLQ